MKLRICLASPDRELSAYFGRLKDNAVPREILQRGYYAARGVSVATSSYFPEGAASKEGLESFLIEETYDAARCIVLLDDRWGHLAREIKTSLFYASLDIADMQSSQLNFLRKTISTALKAFGQVAQKFDNGTDAKLLQLPLRNFHSVELAELARLCADESLSSSLANDVEAQLALLRNRVRPRRSSSFQTKYAVDDVPRFFSYGNERHSRPETGGDHSSSCILASQFRFGCRIDDRRHYNVSENETDQTTVDGLFYNCHGVEKRESRKTHLNVFSSDFYN